MTTPESEHTTEPAADRAGEPDEAPTGPVATPDGQHEERWAEADAEPEPQPEPEPEPTALTGDPRVDQAVESLAQIGGLPAAEQVAAYEAVHRTLQDTLASVDDG